MRLDISDSQSSAEAILPVFEKCLQKKEMILGIDPNSRIAVRTMRIRVPFWSGVGGDGEGAMWGKATRVGTRRGVEFVVGEDERAIGTGGMSSKEKG